MQKILTEEKAVKLTSLNGIDVYYINTGKFKTNTINIFMHDNLSMENVTRNALIPAVLRRGCGKFPTFKDIALYLEELFGATFDCGISKKGERQIVQFYAEYVSERYTGSRESTFEKISELLFEIITDPVLEDNAFREEYVLQEKDSLKRLIESRVNDKVQYSVDKCSEEMCKEEPFGIYEYGYVSELDKIDSKSLYAHYKNFIRTAPMQIFISGEIEQSKIDAFVNKFSKMERSDFKTVDISSVEKKVSQVKHAAEKMSISQGKLSMGFRTNTASNDKDYYSLLVYNGILGGGTHSKLFQNVREKASLAYYVFSRLEKFKGLMLISGGVEFENKDKAIEIILKQIDEINAGNISDYEFDSTKKTIETGINSLKDNQMNIVDFYLSQAIVGTEDTFNSINLKISKVTKEDVVSVARKVKLDTVYFLTGEAGQAAGE